MSSTTSANGRGRTSLAGQLDRLDLILDNLAEGLHEAVAGAVERAVCQAVRAAVAEVLDGPEVLEALRLKLAPARRPANGSRLVRAWGWVTGTVRAAAAWCAGQVSAACSVCRVASRAVGGGCVRQVCRAARSATPAWGRLVLTLALVVQVRHLVAVALGAGLVVGVLAYLGGHLVAAAGSGLGGFVSALAVQAGLWLRRAVRTGTGPRA